MRANQLLIKISSLACPHCQSKKCWELVSKPQVRMNSVTAVVRCAQCNMAFFLKHIIRETQEESIVQAKHEYQVTKTLYLQFPDKPDVAVVKPFCLINTVLVMEYIPGQSPAGLLKSASMTEAKILMGKLGSWFGHFHQAGEASEGRVDLSEKYTALSNRLSAISSASCVANQALFFLEKQLVNYDGQLVPHRQLHGDAKPDNFIIHKRRIVGIDVDCTFRNLQEHDLAQFLAHFRLTCGSMFKRIDKHRIYELETSFLNSYSSTAQFNPEFVAWLKVYYLLNFWLSWRSPGLLYRLHWDRQFENCIYDSI